VTPPAAAGGQRGSRARQHVWVSGDVQGVGFRYTCYHQASAVGAAGWVRNLPDGRVEAVFEGSPDAVAQLVAWCRRGPRFCQVEDVTVVDEPLEGLTSFEIY
jgi:acylphosphatase